MAKPFSIGLDTYRQYLNIEFMFNHEKTIDKKIYDAKLAAMKFIINYYRNDENCNFKNELQLIRER